MPFRVRLKAIFKSNSSSESTSPTSSETSSSSTNTASSNQDTSALRLTKSLTKNLTSSSNGKATPPRRGIGDPKVYQPGEIMPRPKYRGIVDKKHKQLLDDFAFGESNPEKKKTSANRLALGGRSTSATSTASGISPGASRKGSYSSVSAVTAAANAHGLEGSGIHLVLGEDAATAIGGEKEKKTGWFKRTRSGMGNPGGAGMEQVDEGDGESEDAYAGIPVRSAISPLGLSVTSKDIPVITTTSPSTLPDSPAIIATPLTPIDNKTTNTIDNNISPPISPAALATEPIQPSSFLPSPAQPQPKPEIPSQPVDPELEPTAFETDSQLEKKIDQCDADEELIDIAKKRAEQLIKDAKKQAETKIATEDFAK